MKKNFSKQKFKGRGGFTLAELLIVVAIIAVLALVSIPVFASKLETSKEETDISNMRAAKAAAVSQYLQGVDLNGDVLDQEGMVCYFDAGNGNLTYEKPDGYGQGTETDGNCEDFALIYGENIEQKYYSSDSDVENGVIVVAFNYKGDIVLEWDKGNDDYNYIDEFRPFNIGDRMQEEDNESTSKETFSCNISLLVPDGPRNPEYIKTTLNLVEGMTWEEWVNSKYNIEIEEDEYSGNEIEIYKNGNMVVCMKNADSSEICDGYPITTLEHSGDDPIYVKPGDVIQKNKIYGYAFP